MNPNTLKHFVYGNCRGTAALARGRTAMMRWLLAIPAALFAVASVAMVIVALPPLTLLWLTGEGALWCCDQMGFQWRARS